MKPTSEHRGVVGFFFPNTFWRKTVERLFFRQDCWLDMEKKAASKDGEPAAKKARVAVAKNGAAAAAAN